MISGALGHFSVLFTAAEVGREAALPPGEQQGLVGPALGAV